MGRLHENKNGQWVACRAVKKPCPLGATNAHADSVEAVEKGLELLNEPRLLNTLQGCGFRPVEMSLTGYSSDIPSVLLKDEEGNAIKVTSYSISFDITQPKACQAATRIANFRSGALSVKRQLEATGTLTDGSVVKAQLPPGGSYCSLHSESGALFDLSFNDFSSGHYLTKEMRKEENKQSAYQFLDAVEGFINQRALDSFFSQDSGFNEQDEWDKYYAEDMYSDMNEWEDRV